MRSILISFLFLQFFCACNSGPDRSDTTQTSENEVDAARNFIRLSLDGKWDAARNMLVPDTLNNNYLDLAEKTYHQRMDLATRNGYRGASIIIHSFRNENDSVSIVQYSNSYKKQQDSLRVVQRNGRRLVDLKYSFPPTKKVAE